MKRNPDAPKIRYPFIPACLNHSDPFSIGLERTVVVSNRVMAIMAMKAKTRRLAGVTILCHSDLVALLLSSSYWNDGGTGGGGSEREGGMVVVVMVAAMTAYGGMGWRAHRMEAKAAGGKEEIREW